MHPQGAKSKSLVGTVEYHFSRNANAYKRLVSNKLCLLNIVVEYTFTLDKQH